MASGTQIVDSKTPVLILGLVLVPLEDAVRSFDDTRGDALIVAAKRFSSVDDEDDEDDDFDDAEAEDDDDDEEDEDDEYEDDEDDDEDEDEDDEYEDDEDEDEDDGEEISLI